MPKRALVTGATGFIGSHLVRHLLQEGWVVGVLGHKESLTSDALDCNIQSFYYSGITSEVIKSVTEFQPDVVYHLASLFLATHTADQIESLITSNVLFGTQLLEAIGQSRCRVLINAGTGWQNYTPEPPFDLPVFSPVNLYAATKQAFEDIALFYVQTTQLRMITLRLFDSYGPGDSRRKLLRLLLDALKTEQPLGMSPGDQILDLVHVDDICRAFLHAAKRASEDLSQGAAVFAVSGKERMTLQAVVQQLEKAARRRLPVEFGRRPHRPREVIHPWDGPELPGWQPTITLLEGFSQLIWEEKKQTKRSNTSG
jgi:nucleoside-diphosphate-sugar epimerase